MPAANPTLPGQPPVIVLGATPELLSMLLGAGAVAAAMPDTTAPCASGCQTCPASEPANSPAQPTLHRFGRAWLDVSAARLTGADGTPLAMTAMEFSLLRLFALNPRRVLNRDQILEGAHDRSWDPFDRSIDIRISRIRRKIEINPRNPAVIRTVRGVGYIYDPS